MTNNRAGPYSRDLSLLDLLDRLVDKDVVVHGDLVLSIAGVDLIYVGLRLLVCPVDYLGERPRRGSGDLLPDRGGSSTPL